MDVGAFETLDNAAPTVSITARPSDPTNQNDAFFQWTGSDNATQTSDLRYDVKIDNGDWSSFGTETSFAWHFNEGLHTISFKAVDQAGNESDSVSYTWKVDTTAPGVTSVSPANLAKMVSPGFNVGATFSEGMKASSINADTFKLYKKGSTTTLSAVVTYDSATHTTTLDPSVNLKRGTTYRAVIGAGARDLAGNHLATAKIWTFTSRN